MPPPLGAKLFQDPAFLGTTGLLIAVLLAGAGVLALLDRWKRQQLQEDAIEPAESLGGFRKMFERGELTQQEYHAVRLKMANRLKGLPGPAGDGGPVPEGIADDPAGGDGSADGAGESGSPPAAPKGSG